MRPRSPSPGRTLALYTASHFVVDFCCFALLFGVFAPAMPDLETVTLGFLVYNVLAFGLQPLAGALWDEHAGPDPALLGALLLAAGLLLGALPWAALAVCAVGNALFHVGGGIDSLTRAGGALGRGGVFVSSGALGVALGTLAGKALPLPGWAWALPALACAGALWLWGPRVRIPERAEGFRRLGAPGRTGGAILALCLLSVAARAYVGFLVPIPWKGSGGTLLALLPACCAFGGKLAGGLLADRLGARNVGVVSLLLSLPLLVLGSGSAPLCAAGLLLFNMTMAITLGGVAGQLPGSPGLAFGLTTLALLCGTVPSFFLPVPEGLRRPLAAVLVALSALCIHLAFGKERSHEKMA